MLESVLVRKFLPKKNKNLLPQSDTASLRSIQSDKARSDEEKLCFLSEEGEKVMTARQFAERMGVNYWTVLNWLEAGLVPGAERKSSLIGEY